MHLISTLNSGISAAANGWAEVYVRGTSNRATVYYDFEASTSDSSGDNITLDAYGAVEVYVNQLVDVVAKAADGTVVRSWTDGYAAPNVEVISPAFTGTDYISGSTGVSKPTTVKEVLDRWLTTNGAPDWKVDVGGVPTDLPDALGTISELVYNVKSPEFGAVGDGVTNDQAAIQAALSAASNAGGGIVFFPKGTYLTTSVIPLDNLVSMVGVGVDQSVIAINSATDRVFALFSSVALDSPFVIQGLTFQSAQANTGSQVYLQAACKCLVRGCVFGGSSLAAGYGIEYAANVRLDVQGCWFNINSSSLGAIAGSGGANGSRVRVRDCTIVGPSSFTGYFLDLRNTFRASVTGCMFDGSTNSTTGTHYAITTTNSSIVTGNDFYGGSFTAAINYVSATVAIARDNVFVGATVRYATSAILSEGSYLEMRNIATVGSTATPTIPDCVDICQFESTTTVPTWTFPTRFYYGQRLLLLIRNNSGAGWGAMTFSGTIATTNIGYPSIANTASAAIEFVVSNLGGGSDIWRGIRSTG